MTDQSRYLPLQLKVMESFFEREVQRIEFVNKRNQLREAEKKALDQEKIEKQQVTLNQCVCSAVLYIENHEHTCFLQYMFVAIHVYACVGKAPGGG